VPVSDKKTLERDPFLRLGGKKIAEKEEGDKKGTSADVVISPLQGVWGGLL